MTKHFDLAFGPLLLAAFTVLLTIAGRILQ